MARRINGWLDEVELSARIILALTEPSRASGAPRDPLRSEMLEHAQRLVTLAAELQARATRMRDLIERWGDPADSTVVNFADEVARLALKAQKAQSA